MSCSSVVAMTEEVLVATLPETMGAVVLVTTLPETMGAILSTALPETMGARVLVTTLPKTMGAVFPIADVPVPEEDDLEVVGSLSTKVRPVLASESYTHS